VPEETYTLAEAADRIGIREDTLTSMLPDLNIDPLTRAPMALTQAEYDGFSELIQRLKVLHIEGMEL
jgi:hypothetical protein